MTHVFLTHAILMFCSLILLVTLSIGIFIGVKISDYRETNCKNLLIETGKLSSEINSMDNNR